MIKVGVIGYGYWGPNLVRNLSAREDCQVTAVADLRKERLALLHKAYPGMATFQDAKALLCHNGIDCVVIATPVSTHYPLARQALKAGKHVLLEKPMTRDLKEAQELVETAQKKKKVLMVDHTFLYTGAVRKMREVVDSGSIGHIQYFDSTRINLGLFQHDINVTWDLAPHDLSILLTLVKELPCSVIATGISHTRNKIENIAYITLHYRSSMIAHFSCSWSSPVKIRKILIGGTERMIVFDDIEPTEKVKVYNTSYRVTTEENKQQMLVDYRVGDIFTPKVDLGEALGGVCDDFIGAVKQGRNMAAHWKNGINVVRILEAAETSMRHNGREVKL